MSTSSSFRYLRRGAGLAALAGAGLCVASAQTAAQPSLQPANVFQQGAGRVQPLNFSSSAVPNFVAPADEVSSSLSSSSSSLDSYDPQAAAQTQLASLEKSFGLPGVNAMQYGQRRRYGAPRYRGGNTNADGSEKYTFFAGAGFTAPVGDNSSYLGPSYSFQVGAGRNFNAHLGLNLQFDWDNFSVSGDSINSYANTIAGDPTNENGFGAHSHIWSFTLNPTYQIYSGPGLGAYVVVGGGFYHKETTFTIPEVGEGYDYYGYPYEYEANVPVQNYSSNSGGVSGGLGLTYKFSRFSNERLYAEVRAVHTFNSYRPASTIYEDGSVSGWNFFPQNSETTTYFPVKFGIRF